MWSYSAWTYQAASRHYLVLTRQLLRHSALYSSVPCLLMHFTSEMVWPWNTTCTTHLYSMYHVFLKGPHCIIVFRQKWLHPKRWWQWSLMQTCKVVRAVNVARSFVLAWQMRLKWQHEQSWLRTFALVRRLQLTGFLSHYFTVLNGFLQSDTATQSQ